MGITVGVNNNSAAHKASGGITISFPDVCLTSAPGGAVPIPYPNIAKTATEKQKSASKGQNTASRPATKYSTRRGESVASHIGPNPGMVQTGDLNSKQLEIQQLRSLLSSLHQQILALPPTQPDRWQKLLQDYCVTASALYVTQSPD